MASVAQTPDENTGRWLQEEHERFLRGLNLFGKKWTKVAEVVGTRTTVQVRSHAQKYFQKVKEGKMAAGGGLAVTRLGSSKNPGMKTNVPPQLQPYMPSDGEDIVTALYQYLTPVEIPATKKLKTPKAEGGGEIASPAPSWYNHGHGLGHLLGEAEDLDWVADSGTEVSRELSDDSLSSPIDDKNGSANVVDPTVPTLEATFSTMEVDDQLFEALIDDGDFMACTPSGSSEGVEGKIQTAPPHLFPDMSFDCFPTCNTPVTVMSPPNEPTDAECYQSFDFDALSNSVGDPIHLRCHSYSTPADYKSSYGNSSHHHPDLSTIDDSMQMIDCQG